MRHTEAQFYPNCRFLFCSSLSPNSDIPTPLCEIENWFRYLDDKKRKNKLKKQGLWDEVKRRERLDEQGAAEDERADGQRQAALPGRGSGGARGSVGGRGGSGEQAVGHGRADDEEGASFQGPERIRCVVCLVDLTGES